jgi:hypothetical protein
MSLVPVLVERTQPFYSHCFCIIMVRLSRLLEHGYSMRQIEKQIHQIEDERALPVAYHSGRKMTILARTLRSLGRMVNKRSG